MASSWIDQEAREHAKLKAIQDYDAREAQSQARSLHESEQTEKTLHHLAGRVEELRVRLERVLVPEASTSNGAPGASGSAESFSPLTSRLRSFHNLAQSSINVVEDILNRLDV